MDYRAYRDPGAAIVLTLIVHLYRVALCTHRAWISYVTHRYLPHTRSHAHEVLADLVLGGGVVRRLGDAAEVQAHTCLKAVQSSSDRGSAALNRSKQHRTALNSPCRCRSPCCSAWG
jgi:hypothetical protein